MSELCINCEENPIEIKKRKLCRRCYQKLYVNQKGKTIWPISDKVIHGDIQKEVQKNPEYKKYVKEQANQSVKELVENNN